MSQTPTPPAGWYPQGDQERWWNGTAWSDNFRPLGSETTPPQYSPYSAPAQVPYGTPTYATPTYGVPQQPVQKSNLARNLLITFAVIFLLFVGGCVALVAIVGNAVDDAVNDDTPGGPNNPLTIVQGEAFSVDGFDYAAGWSLAAGQVTGTMEVNDLKVTNNRDSAERLFVRIEVLDAGTVVASATCDASDGATIGQGNTVAVDCSSGDPLPVTYDEITIQDVF